MIKIEIINIIITKNVIGIVTVIAIVIAIEIISVIGKT